MRKILKGAVLLLITIALFLSTVAIADTNIKQTLSSSLYSIDIEKYVWDPVSQEWVDADIEYLALDLPICTDVEFKIIILNEGTETLYDIEVADQMGEKLKYISAVPAPDFFEYNPPFLDMRWDFPGPLDPGHYNQISILAHVEGPHGNTSYNVAITNALDLRSGGSVANYDFAWVRAIQKSREINNPFLNFLQSHPNMFPLLQLLIQRLGLQ